MINNVENSENDVKSVIKVVPVLFWLLGGVGSTVAARSCEVWALFEVGRQRPLCSSARAHARADTQTGEERLTKRESARERESESERAPVIPPGSGRACVVSPLCC